MRSLEGSPELIGLGSLREDQETAEAHRHSGRAGWDAWRRRLAVAERRRFRERAPVLAGTLMLDFSLQTYEKVNECGFGHSVCGGLFQQPELTDNRRVDQSGGKERTCNRWLARFVTWIQTLVWYVGLSYSCAGAPWHPPNVREGPVLGQNGVLHSGQVSHVVSQEVFYRVAVNIIVSLIKQNRLEE